MEESDLKKLRQLEDENDKQFQVIEELRFENQNLIRHKNSIENDNEELKLKFNKLNTKFHNVEFEYNRIKNEFELKKNPVNMDVKESLVKTKAASTILEWED